MTAESLPHLILAFDSGTLVLDGLPAEPDSALADSGLDELATLDPRDGRFRAPADAYRPLFAALHRAQVAGALTYRDEARAYAPLELRWRGRRTPRDYQREAIEAWTSAGKRGLVVLPTGAGKSFVAQLAIALVDRATLVVVPTLDLVHQWYDGLLAAFDVDHVGQLGGGEHDVQAITVTTYDSFHLHAPRYGDRFGLIVFDECHHLGAPSYLDAASAMIAPFRLGLTATPERQDGRDRLLDSAVGPIAYRKHIKDLTGTFLADYDVESIEVHLTEEEAERYAEHRQRYLAFVRSAGIRFSRADGWSQFVIQSSRTREGRRAMKSYQEQRRIALTCTQKVLLVERLLLRHAKDRVIVFTNDNDTVYVLSRRLLLPAITHQTPTKERRELLQRFRDGTYPALVTAKVLNEGVDVPEARVAIVLSGSGSVREHVQRLGRILRKSEGKRALLYEVITRNTVEERVSERRREHDAYRSNVAGPDDPGEGSPQDGPPPSESPPTPNPSGHKRDVGEPPAANAAAEPSEGEGC